MNRVCIIGASGKLGRYMVELALAKGYEVNAVCRPQSVTKLAEFKGRINLYPGKTDDRHVIKQAVRGCDGVLTVLVPWGMRHYASGTAQAVLDFSEVDARLIFSCGWHISKDGKDVYSWQLNILVNVFAKVAKWLRWVDLDDQVTAFKKIFSSQKKWTAVRGSSLKEGASQGLPVWARHVGDPILKSDLTRRIDFALFMVEALKNDDLIQEAPAIVGCHTRSARAVIQHNVCKKV